jgi:HD-GYP domain-containing protein (c-di-GMP phosphodiesterase class II)
VTAKDKHIPDAADDESGGSERFLAVELEMFRPDSLVGCDLFLHLKELGRFVLYKRKDLQISFTDIERLISNNVRSLFVDAGDEHIIRDYLEDNLSNFMDEQNISIDKKSQLLYECAIHRVEETLKNPESGENIHKSKNIVKHLVNYILSDSSALHSLMNMMSHDYYTYTHSVNVCTFSIALSKFTGEGDNEKLRALGLGALLHDVGKRLIPEEILQKKGPLTDDEMELVKKHPLHGLEIVSKLSSFLIDAEAIVVHHHEKCNGKGYPHGKTGNEINPFAKLVCIVDIFDALTSHRPYRRAIRTFPALKLMKEEMVGELDIYFFNSLIQMLKK